MPKNIFSSSLSLKDIDELEIARQLTLIDFNIFALVTPIEFLNRYATQPMHACISLHRAKDHTSSGSPKLGGELLLLRCTKNDVNY